MHHDYGIKASIAELVRQRGAAASLGAAPRARVRTLHAGGHASTFRGRGMEFDETRAYQPGDDVRSIDWRVTARTGRVHTKLFHEERERPVLLLVDVRPHMRFGTRDAFKSVVAARAAATVAWAARDGGDRVGGLVLSGTGYTEIPPQRSRARLLSFLGTLSRATGEEECTSAPPRLAGALDLLVRVSRPGTLLFVISDFADLDDDAERSLARLARHCEVACVLVFDGLEATPPDASGCRISDGARVLELPASSERWRSEYVARFAERRERVASLCRRRGAAFLPLETGEDCAAVLRVQRFLHNRTGAATRQAPGGGSR